MIETVLDARLAWVANQVRPDVCVIDVGTDHARLPIALVQSGKTQHAIAADVAKRPLQQAQTHIAAAQLSAQIQTVLSDGLQNIALPESADITICGMGGDAMVKIIAAKPELRQTSIRLLLQPQTETALLRQFLAQEGFVITDETILQVDERIYQAFVTVFTGCSYDISLLEAEVGKLNMLQRSEVLLKYVSNRQAVVHKWQQAKLAAGQDVAWEAQLLMGYRQVLQA